MITILKDFGKIAFTKGGLEFWNLQKKSYVKNAWKKENWHSTRMALKIDHGLFATNASKTVIGQGGELFSRFTWQLPQTMLGYLATKTHNILGGIRSVTYHGGATVAESFSRNWGGIALGNYINGEKGIHANVNNALFRHEYGHYLQSQTGGLFYLQRYGIPSLLSKKDSNHSLHPVEQDANIRAFIYFRKYLNQEKRAPFNKFLNPIIGYDWSQPLHATINQLALKSGHLRLAWYDWALLPNIIISGLINTFILNKKY